MHYLRVMQTYGWKYIYELTSPMFKFLSINFAEKYGLKTLSAQSMHAFAQRLELGGTKAIIEYITDKAGYYSKNKYH